MFQTVREEPAAPDRSLLSDQSGATMVMGVFMAMVVVGMIYYVWGLGGTIVYRERLQDAADTAALGAAVVHARGMNLVVILNVIMAAFAVVGTAARVIQDIILAAGLDASAECAECFFGECDPCWYALVYLGFLGFGGQWSSARDMADRVERAIDPIIHGVHVAQRAVQRGAPVLADTLVTVDWGNLYRPTTSGAGSGTMLPVPLTSSGWDLEVQDDDTMWACHHVSYAPTLYVSGPAAILGAAGVWAFADPSRHLGVGLLAAPVSAIFRSERYCDDDYRTFQRVRDGSALGEEAFQLRTIFRGVTPPHRWTQSGVAIANWGRQAGTEPALGIGAAQELHQWSVAQAEYYYEPGSDTGNFLTGNPQDREEWMWHAYWRARLRRVRFSAGTGLINSLLGGVQDVMVH